MGSFKSKLKWDVYKISVWKIAYDGSDIVLGTFYKN